jgi:hypothetical protein
MDNREPAQAWLQATLEALQPVMEVPQQVLLQVRQHAKPQGLLACPALCPEGLVTAAGQHKVSGCSSTVDSRCGSEQTWCIRLFAAARNTTQRVVSMKLC